MKQIWTALAFCFATINTQAQGYVDQEKVAPILNSQTGDANGIQPVTWTVYNYKQLPKASKHGAWTTLKSYLDSLPGTHQGQRLEIVELANRVTSDKLKTGRLMAVPSNFDADYRAYSPYPIHYDVADTVDKLFIIDKYTQTFGAYEYGKLVRWGLVSTGSTDDKTPIGRFLFTWKAEYRESSEAPEGETWKMNYVFNFNPSRGIHVHQYSLPIAQPASHGCVRLTMADAIWNYNWANGTEDGTPGKSTEVWVINYSPVGLAAHWDISESGVQSLVRLPIDAESVGDRSYAQY